MTPKYTRNYTCRKCEGNIGEAMELKDKLSDEVVTVIKLTYLVDKESACGRCKAAVTTRRRCGWSNSRELS